TPLAPTTVNFASNLLALKANSPNQDLTYYVQLRDSNGMLIGGAKGGWIKLDSAFLNLEQELDISQKDDPRVDHILFEPLSLGFDPGMLSPTLLQALARGDRFQIEVAAYAQQFDGSSKLIDDYRFSESALQSLGQNLADETQTYDFAYGAEAVTHYIFGPD